MQDFLNTRGITDHDLPDLLADTGTATVWARQAVERWAENRSVTAPVIEMTTADLRELRALRATFEQMAGQHDAGPPRSGQRDRGARRRRHDRAAAGRHRLALAGVGPVDRGLPGPAGRHLAEAEVVSQYGVRVGLLRHVPQQQRCLAQRENLRKRRQPAGVTGAPAHTGPRAEHRPNGPLWITRPCVILAYVFASPLHDIRLQQALPPNLLVYVTALVAFIAVAVPVLWRICRNVITIAHEGGHALVAVLCGRRLQSIRLRSDTSGLTITKGKPRGFGAILTLAVGYITPSLVGIVGAYLLATHHIRVTLWVSIGLLLVILVMIRNLYGFVAVIATGAAVFAVSWWASSQVQAAFAYTGGVVSAHRRRAPGVRAGASTPAGQGERLRCRSTR